VVVKKSTIKAMKKQLRTHYFQQFFLTKLHIILKRVLLVILFTLEMLKNVLEGVLLSTKHFNILLLPLLEKIKAK
jgi:hypothetical protein